MMARGRIAVVWVVLLLAAPLATAPGPVRAQTSGEDDVAPIVLESRAGGYRLSLEADRRSMPIDGRLRLSLLAEAPAETLVSFPDIGTRLGSFAVVGETVYEPPAAAPAIGQWRHDYVLEAEDVGELTVPPLPVIFQRPDDLAAGAAERLATEPLTITVTSVLPPDVDITSPRDIAPPVALPEPGLPWAFWLSIGLALTLAALAFLWWRRRVSRAAAPVLQPAHRLALAELERLRAEALAGPPSVEEWHVRLADVVRRYVGWRFGLRATMQTTEELLATVRRGSPPVGGQELIGRVLGQCDLVKFARLRPGSGAVHDALDRAREFIERTADDAVTVRGLPAGPVR